MIGTRDGDGFVYDRFFQRSTAAYGRFGSILDLPVTGEPYAYLRQVVEREFRGKAVLDYGCGASQPLRTVLGSLCEYYSCDSDPSGSFSYRDLSEVEQGRMFSVVSANQVIEHIPFRESIEVVKRLCGLLNPGGLLMLSVPNTYHPVRFQSSPLHINPVNYLNLCAMMEDGGVEPVICARYGKTGRPRWYQRPLIDLVCRTFRIDWCDSVYVVGRKPAG